MHTPEDYLLDALEIVSSWDLTDEASIVNAANQQARLMAGQLDLEGSFEATPAHTFRDQH